MKEVYVKRYLMSGSADDGWEDGSWSIVSGETGFAHTGSVVNNEGGDFVFVTHFAGFWFLRRRRKRESEV